MSWQFSCEPERDCLQCPVFLHEAMLRSFSSARSRETPESVVIALARAFVDSESDQPGSLTGQSNNLSVRRPWQAQTTLEENGEYLEFVRVKEILYSLTNGQSL